MGNNANREAAKTLYNIMFDELAEFNLSHYELSTFFTHLLLLSVLSFEKEGQEKKGILSFVDCNSDKCTEQEIEVACSCLGMDKYALRYFAHYFGKDSHLHQILRSYTETFELPKSKQDFLVFFRSSGFDRDHFDDFVDERIMDYENNCLQWYLQTLNRRTVPVPNAVHIWPESEGFFRFIDRNGKWGIVDKHTLKITMLPDNVIEMNDFNNFRARVLVGNKTNIRIPYDNRILVDCCNTEDLFWNYVDMRGNFIDNNHYSSAEDFGKDTAKVSMSQKAINWGFKDSEKGVPCPYDNMEIDMFGNLTDECAQNIKDSLSKVKERESKKRFYRNINSGGDDEDNIMGALEHGYGDIYGY